MPIREHEGYVPFEEELKEMSLEELRKKVDQLRTVYRETAQHFSVSTEDFPEIKHGIPMRRDEQIVNNDKAKYQAAKAELMRREAQEKPGTSNE